MLSTGLFQRMALTYYYCLQITLEWDRGTVMGRLLWKAEMSILGENNFRRFLVSNEIRSFHMILTLITSRHLKSAVGREPSFGLALKWLT